MRRSDYIQLLSSGLLSVSERNFNKLLEFTGTRFELKELRKSQRVSVGARGFKNEELGLQDWVAAFRKKEVKQIRFFYASFNNGSLEPHIAAAFAGVQDSILQVTTDQTQYFYTLQTFFSPAYAITPKQFTELVNAQPNASAQWETVEKLIQESNQLNNWPLIEKGSVQTYLNRREGLSTFERQVSDFMRELQINASLEERDFIIPEHLKSLFYKSEFSFGGSGADIAYLYPIEKVDAENILALIDAQPFTDEVWKKVESYYKTYPSEEIPAYTSREWPAALKSMEGDLVNALGFSICRSICEVCEEKKIQPVIPPDLNTLFGPDEVELKRIKARGALSDTQWYLNSNIEGWELYFFEQLNYEGVMEKPVSKETLKSQYKKALAEIEKFAVKIQSAYAEAFRLANYLINTSADSSAFDEARLNKIKEELNRRNFSDRAIEKFSNIYYYSEELQLMNWSSEDIYAFWAVSVSDVFGGMGSWNDEYMESREDYELYQKLSAELFNSLKEYYLMLLSK